MEFAWSGEIRIAEKPSVKKASDSAGAPLADGSQAGFFNLCPPGCPAMIVQRNRSLPA